MRTALSNTLLNGAGTSQQLDIRATENRAFNGRAVKEYLLSSLYVNLKFKDKCRCYNQRRMYHLALNLVIPFKERRNKHGQNRKHPI